MQDEIKKITDRVETEKLTVTAIFNELNKVIVGQKNLIDRLLIGLLSGGHILLEGVPGLAKTKSIVTLSTIVDASFKRIQFTPDLLPSDILGTLIYEQNKQVFTPKLGPIFANFILADEINRAPAKVQSALLECMQEKQVTLGDVSYRLEEPFLVLATQNPIDQEGTYSLPEAQVDRFLMKVKIDYPKKEEEREIIKRSVLDKEETAVKVLTKEKLIELKQLVSDIYVDNKVLDYVVDIVFATREPEKYNLEKIQSYIDFGASPRASISLIQAAKAHAFLQGRGFVTPEDIKAIGPDVLRHRVIPSFEADAEELNSDDLISTIFSEIEVP
tara:strand:- start:86 stop:1075 length:990 start_codon:yes stop_codon:yes gene_type:complete